MPTPTPKEHATHGTRNHVSGALLIDKPVGVTSHDVVDAVRRAYGTRAVGHCGTLDPAASGLLIVLLERATKVAPLFSGLDKTYRALVHLGATSDTGDADGRITPGGVVPPISHSEFVSLLRRFQGAVTLPIPIYAAVRTGGRRRHDLARRGLPVPEATRTSTIHRLDVQRYDLPQVEIRVDCTAGTYVRSLAAAIGDAVGCGGYLAALRRERIGVAHIEQSVSLEAFEVQPGTAEALPQPRPFEEYLSLPIIEFSPDRYEAVSHGRVLEADDIIHIAGVFDRGTTVLLRPAGGRVVAVAEATFSSTEGPTEDRPLRYQRVLI